MPLVFTMKNTLLAPALIALTALLAAPGAAHAQAFASGQNADVVIGKPNFTTSTPATPTASNLGAAAGAFVDPVSGKLFVSDPANNRVLRFSSAAAAASASAAEAVFGQPDFTTGTANTGGRSSTSLSNPTGIFVDSTGALWVADSNNNRVLRFDAATTDPVTIATLTADQVLGQGDFTTGAANTTSSTLSSPNGVCLDTGGRLYVADYANNRVLRFDGAAALANGAAATVAFGQLLFTTSTSGDLSTQMDNPYGVSVDAAGRLWVADFSNNRVLRFDNAAAAAVNDPAADAVLGQAGFGASTAGTTQAAMSGPTGVFAATDGRLWVSEYTNNRVTWFDNAAAVASGGAASGVLGQTTFTSAASGLTQSAFNLPSGVFQDVSGHVWVSDFANRRALRFTALPTPALQAPLISLRGKAKRTTAAAKLQIDGLSGDEDGTVVSVKGNVNSGSYTNAKGTSPWHYIARHLKYGTNHIKIRAIDNSGLKSAFLRVTIIRRR